MRNFGPALDIDHVACRVADGLAEQGACVLINSLFHGIEIVMANHLALNALVRQRVREQVVGAAV